MTNNYTRNIEYNSGLEGDLSVRATNAFQSMQEVYGIIIIIPLYYVMKYCSDILDIITYMEKFHLFLENLEFCEYNNLLFDSKV